MNMLNKESFTVAETEFVALRKLSAILGFLWQKELQLLSW